jgi:hypothetical protein
MSASTKNNIRKIILLNVNQNNNKSRQVKINKQFPKIALSNDILSYTNKDTKPIKFRSQTDPDIVINKSKLTSTNNIHNIIKIDSITNTTDTLKLNHIPSKKNEHELKNSTKKDKKKFEQKLLLKSPKIDDNSISLSNVYKLPTILKNDYNTIRSNLLSKKPKVNRLSNNNIYIPQGKTLNPNINILSSNKSQDLKDMKERLSSRGLTGINNDVNINIIDYNKICVKRKLNPVNINRISSLFNSKFLEDDSKERVERYMKDRFYSDTETKMVKKLKYTVFNHDNSLKDKIIKMKKISGFWGGLADYCIPIFSLRKFEYIKEKLKKQRLKGKSENISEDENKMKYDVKPSKLFTINSFLNYKHQKNLEIKKEFIEKYNDSMEYYMI